MRNVLSMLAIVGLLVFSTAAYAGEQYMLDCVDMPSCCMITCAVIDVDCCECDWPASPLVAEFLDSAGNVLGTASFGGNWCCGEETYAELDKPVDADAVCAVRLVKQDDNVTVTWASLKVFCGDECWGKWYKVFKGDLWCWEPIPAVAPPPPPAPPAEPPVVTPPPAPAPAPKPEPRFEMPEEQPAPEPEVIVVPGRG